MQPVYSCRKQHNRRCDALHRCCRLGALPAPPCAAPARLRRRRRCVQASAAPELEQAAAGGALLDALPAVPPVPSPEELEAREELALAAGKGDIYGIPRSEWLKLQSPARYLGNEVCERGMC